MGIDRKAAQRPLLRFFRELAGLQGHALSQADRFLFLIHQFVRTVGANLHDDKPDGIGTQVDDCYTFHSVSFDGRFS